MGLSSGEAEYSALVKAVAEGIGLQSIFRDLGLEASVEVCVDSSTSKSIASRIGVGKVRHIHTELLGIRFATAIVKLTKIPGCRNPSDVLSKPMPLSEMNCKLHSAAIEVLSRKLRWADMIDEETR